MLINPSLRTFPTQPKKDKKNKKKERMNSYKVKKNDRKKLKIADVKQ
jgi:hypothetical protein